MKGQTLFAIGMFLAITTLVLSLLVFSSSFLLIYPIACFFVGYGLAKMDGEK